MSNSVLETADGRRIAYVSTKGRGPGVIFLGGLRSDMTGTKALYLEDWARSRDRAFLRFDYTGHGASSGRFEDGCIGDWAADAETVISQLTAGPQILVGSSMGGWIALLLAKRFPDRLRAMIGIAAAPDFTENSMWSGATAAQRAELMEHGRITLPSDYSDDPYLITRRLIEDGRENLVLRSPLRLPFPVRLLHGTADEDVPQEVPLRLLAHATGPDIRLTLVKDADHRFSTPECLDMITQSIEATLGP